MKLLMAVVLASNYAGAAAIDVSTGFKTGASCETAWTVLTDYDRLPNFVKSMKRSRSQRESGVLIVEQRARAGFLLAGRTVTVRLRVQETPMSRIEFVDLTDGDFDWYAGAWSLKPEGGGCAVGYELSAELRQAPPRWLADAATSHNVKRLLLEVKQEMERR